jgi:hypothetical protein
MTPEIKAVIEKARCIRHWHDASIIGGMVVSAEAVYELWNALDALDAAQAAQKPECPHCLTSPEPWPIGGGYCEKCNGTGTKSSGEIRG